MNSLATTTTPANDLTRQLVQIGLHATAATCDDFIARATKGRWPAHTMLEEIARCEMSERARRGLQRRLAHARLGRFKPIADFDWNWPKKIERDAIERALTGEFIREGRNFILLGANGLGKTLISKNIGHAAVLAGHSVLFRTAAEMLEDLQVDSPELRRRRLAHYSRPSLLCIDEVGYLAYDNHAADLLFEVVNRRYEQKSLVVTTNRAFKEWNQVFPNATCITTLLDRLTHHADVTKIEGDSYRVRESEQEAAARRKKKP
ncbi:MAG: IS21-like element helper ATPase IstB [Thermoanaerobaculia bacterium]